MIKIKRAYEKPAKREGLRILVDRLWPRGVSKEKLKLYRWEKDVAPSTALRKWFNHDPKKWAEFKKRYRAELKGNPAYDTLKTLSKKRSIILVYAAKDEDHNEAAALQQMLNR